jgi:hypothetical protein
MDHRTLTRRHEGANRAKMTVTIAPQLARAIRDAAAEQGVAVSWFIEDTLSAILFPACNTP